MSTSDPEYRLTIKSPRSVDASEATTLTPVGGAPHSEAFRISSSDFDSDANAWTSAAAASVNGDFETSGTLPPPNYTDDVTLNGGGGTTTLSYETATQFAGVRSLKIVTDHQFGGALTPVFPALPNQVYTISAAMKTLGGKQADAQLMFLDANQAYISGLQPTSTSAAWGIGSVTGAAPAGTAFIRVSLQCNDVGGGTVYFDAVTITPNYRPYLHDVGGQTGTIDPVAKRTTVGSRAITIRDQRLTPGGSNAVRWVTAFLGDASGKLRLKGCKAILEESLDGGSTFATIFTGRVGDVKLSGKLAFVFEIKSSAEDLKKQIFVYDPLPSASYAFRAALFPPRLPKSWGSGTLPAGNWLPALVSGKFTGADSVVRANLDFQLSTEDLKNATLVTKQSLAVSAGLAQALVFMKVTAGGATGAFRVTKHVYGYIRYTENGIVDRRYLTRIGPMEELPASHPLHLAMPANGTAVTCYVQAIDSTTVSEGLPLFIDDVHPIQLWADILDGKFSIPNADYTARPIAPRDTSGGGPWDYANNSFADLPKVRFIITKPEKAADWIIANICQPFNLGYWVDGNGRVVPLDLRLTSSSVTTGTITDADLVELPTDWGLDGSQSLFGANVTYYVDSPKQGVNLRAAPDSFPDMSASLVDSTPQPWLVLNPDLVIGRDAGDTITGIDAKGVRLTPADFAGGAGSLAQIDRLSKVTVAMFDLLRPFAGGSIGVPIKAKRGSTFGASGKVGQLWTATISTLPDPATNQRGGGRVVLILSRTEQKLGVLCNVLDLGSATTATAPSIGALALTNGGLDVPVTLNANSDPAQVEYIVTAAGTGARPAPTDPGWKLVGEAQQLLTASGTARQQGIPANTRLWVRARSKPSRAGSKLPSGYVFPAAGAPAGSIDVAAIAAPSAVAVGSISGNRATVTWTNGDATQQVEVFLTTGGVPGTWTDAMRVTPTLPAGSASVQLRNLTPSIANYAVGIRHRDIYGGTSAFATQTFATTGTPSPAPLVPPIGIGGGGTGGTGIDVAPLTPGPRIDIPVGISLLLNPTDPAFAFEIQHAPDNGSGAANVGAATTIGPNVPGSTRVYHDPQPLDGALHFYRHRHVGYGDTAGGWSDWASAKATIQRLEGPTNAIATPLNAQSRFRCKARLSANVNLPHATETSIIFDAEDADVGSAYNASTGLYTIPAGGDTGMWTFIFTFNFTGNAAGGFRTARIRKNSGAIILGETTQNVTGQFEGAVIAYVPGELLGVGEVIHCTAIQSSGVAENLGGGSQVSNFQAFHGW